MDDRNILPRIPTSVWFVIVALGVVAALALIVPRAESASPQLVAAAAAAQPSPQPASLFDTLPHGGDIDTTVPERPEAVIVETSGLSEHDVQVIVREEIASAIDDLMGGDIEETFWGFFSEAFDGRFDDKFEAYFWDEFENAFADEFDEAFWSAFGDAFENAYWEING